MIPMPLLLALAGQDMAAPVPDRVLAAQRGGFRLPTGVDVAITVRTDTAINGALVLRTVFSADRGAPVVTVFAPRNGQTVASPIPSNAAATGNPTVTVDARGVLQVTPGVANLAIGSRDTGALTNGLEQVASGAVTDNGTIIAAADARRVTLTGDDIAITHLTGTALGSAIANSGSDRTIDTQTSISIDLGGAGPDKIGSAMMRVEDVALGALQARVQ